MSRKSSILVSSEYICCCKTPFDEEISLNISLISDVKEIKNYFSELYKLDINEIIFFFKGIELKEDMLLKSQTIIVNLDKKIDISLGFLNKIKINLEFYNQQNIEKKKLEISSLFRVKTLKKLLEKIFRIDWSQQNWKSLKDPISDVFNNEAIIAECENAGEINIRVSRDA